jgi:hypothetical protein
LICHYRHFKKSTENAAAKNKVGTLTTKTKAIIYIFVPRHTFTKKIYKINVWQREIKKKIYVALFLGKKNIICELW